MLHCVWELDLQISMCVLPSNIFMSKTLEVVKLQDCVAKVPLSVHLPRLKILHLVYLVYPSCELASTFLSLILSGCPVLEDLLLYRVVWEDHGDVWDSEDDVDKHNLMLSVCMPTLKRLEIISNALAERYTRIEIKAPGLKHLKIYEVLCDEFLVDDFPDTLEAHILGFNNIRFNNIRFGDTGRAYETLLKCICKVTALHLAYDPFSEGEGKRNLINVPKLEYLKQLEIDCDFVGSLHALCESSPNLESLAIRDLNAYSFWRREDVLSWGKMPSVPECLLCSLKTFAIELEGLQDELDLAEYILKHGLVLNLVTIERKPGSPLARKSMFKKLAEFPRSSRTCRLEFHGWRDFEILSGHSSLPTSGESLCSLMELSGEA